MRIFFSHFSDVGDSPSDHTQEDIDSEVYPSEDGKFVGSPGVYIFCRKCEPKLCMVGFMNAYPMSIVLQLFQK